MPYNQDISRNHHYPDTFFYIELPKVWRVRQVPDWKTEKEKNSDWGRDWAPVSDYKRYKQTNNRM